MSQFRSTGSLDDSVSEDGDRGFVGVNQRLQLNQLQPGEVRESLNGRMEGYWKPRRNVVAKSPPLTSGGFPLNLPFHILPSPYYKAITAVSYASNVITITITGHGLTINEVGNANISGLTFTGTDNNGYKSITVYDANTLKFPVSGVTAVSLGATPRMTQININDTAAGDVLASCLFSDPNTQNKEYVIVAMESIAKLIDLDGYTISDLKYPTGETVGSVSDMIQAFDRVFIFRDGKQALEYIPIGRPIASASRVGTVITMSVVNHGLKAGDSITISGLTGTVPPNGTYTIATVINESSFTFAVLTGTTTTFNVDNGVMKCHFNLVVAGKYSQPEPISTVEGEFIFTGNTASVIQFDSVEVGDVVELISTTESTQTSGLIQASKFIVNRVFTRDGTVSISSVTASAKITTGEFKDLYAVTINTSSAHGYEVGEPIYIGGIDVNAVNGNRFITSIIDADSFIVHVDKNPTISLSSPYAQRIDGFQFIVDPSNISVHITEGESLLATPIFSRTISAGIGFSHMPAPPWATFFQRRLWMPFYYSAIGTATAPTFTDRKIKDELIASDIIDSDTYDQIYNQFRITGGTADYVVGLQPFYDDTLIVLNRNSIHSIKGTQGSLDDTIVHELTKEIGCLARKSVILRGNTIFFLSDAGVYGLEFLNDYNLRGTEQPLSILVQPYIDRINKNLASGSVATFFDNRYYIALPLDSVEGANDAKGNNSILIFNFLNKGWESLDTYGDSGFLIKNFIVASADIRDNLYAVSSNGGLHQIDCNESSNDMLSISNVTTDIISPVINSSLTSRGYDFRSMGRKRFTDAQIQMQTLAGFSGEYNIAFGAEDPDSAVNIGTTSDFLDGILTPSTPNEAETASIRCRLGGIRGYTGTMILTRTIGSAKIHSLRVSGSETNRQIISQR